MRLACNMDCVACSIAYLKEIVLYFSAFCKKRVPEGTRYLVPGNGGNTIVLLLLFLSLMIR